MYLLLGWKTQHVFQAKNGVVHKFKATGLHPELEMSVFNSLRSGQVGSDLGTSTSCNHLAPVLLFHEIAFKELLEDLSFAHDKSAFSLHNLLQKHHPHQMSG